MIKKNNLLIILLATTINVFANTTETKIENIHAQEVNKSTDQLQRAYEDCIQLYNRDKMTPYENNLNKALKDYILNSTNGIPVSDDSIRETANSLLQYLKTEGSSDDAYSTASIIFMVHWTNVLESLIEGIQTVEAKNALEKTVHDIKTIVNELFVAPIKHRMDQLLD